MSPMPLFYRYLWRIALKRFNNLIVKTILSLGIMFCAPLMAAPIEFHFWPTAIVRYNPEEGGALYGWPQLKVILHDKDSGGNYSPAVINSSLASKLNAMFPPNPDSIVQKFHDETKAQWGFIIAGGSRLRPANQAMLEPMLQSFVSCLSSLTESELSVMEPVFYAPNALIHNGILMLDQEIKDAALKMATNFYRDRCIKSQTSVPQLIKNKSRSYLSALLLGISNIVEINQGTLLVLTSLYSDLFFSSNGIWVRAALSKIQELVTAGLETPPSDSSWLNKDYANFLDYILLTRNSDGFNKNHYLEIAEAGEIKIYDIFKAFPLKQMLENKKISMLHLHIGTTKSTNFIRTYHEVSADMLKHFVRFRSHIL